MQFLSATKLALIAATLSPLASTAWSVAFYDKNDCGESIPYNYYAYGTDGLSAVSECTQVGLASENAPCTYFIDGGASSEECNSQIITTGDSELSMEFPDSTACYVGYDPNCAWDKMVLYQESGCISDELPLHFAGETLYFQCGSECGPDCRGLNVTRA